MLRFILFRNKTPSGKVIDANSTVVEKDPKDPGHMQETFLPGVPGVAYNVIVLNDKYSIEYDCGEELGITNVRRKRKRGDGQG